jgi:hypothetical protein
MTVDCDVLDIETSTLVVMICPSGCVMVVRTAVGCSTGVSIVDVSI